MADVVFVAIALAFFALCVLYVRWCDLIMGPDEVTRADSTDEPDSYVVIDEVAA